MQSGRERVEVLLVSLVALSLVLAACWNLRAAKHLAIREAAEEFDCPISKMRVRDLPSDRYDPRPGGMTFEVTGCDGTAIYTYYPDEKNYVYRHGDPCKEGMVACGNLGPGPLW